MKLALFLIPFFPMLCLALDDIEMAQKFVGQYKVIESKNNCTGITTDEQYSFIYYNPNYSDNYRDSQKIPMNQNQRSLSLNRKVKVATNFEMREGMDWRAAFERPSFAGLNDGDAPDRLPGFNEESSSRIYQSTTDVTTPSEYGSGGKVGSDIIATQQLNVLTPTGAEVRMQMLTLSQNLEFSARRGEAKVPKLSVYKVTYVKYQYFVIKYGPTGLLEQIDAVDECVFKRR